MFTPLSFFYKNQTNAFILFHFSAIGIDKNENDSFEKKQLESDKTWKGGVEQMEKLANRSAPLIFKGLE